MNKPTKSKSKPAYTNDDSFYWENHVKAAQQSSLSRAAYCRQNNISYHRLKYWHYKLTPSANHKVIPIEITTSNSETPLCILELNNGSRLLIHSEEVLAYILRDA